MEAACSDFMDGQKKIKKFSNSKHSGKHGHKFLLVLEVHSPFNTSVITSRVQTLAFSSVNQKYQKS